MRRDASRPASGFRVRAAGLRIAVTVAIAGISTALAACAGMQVPSAAGLGRIGQSALPIGIEKEREIGFGIAAAMAGRYPLSRDAALNEYVSLVGATVAQQSIRSGEIDFVFGVLDTDDVNAFASPGGYIMITRGALALMESESELAGVLAHEVAHVDEKHVLTQIRRQGVMNTATDEAQLSGALLDAVSGAGASALSMGLSREDEEQSDSLAILYASAVGYRPDGMIRFLQHLQAEIAAAEAAGTGGGWRSSHKSPAERIELMRADIAAHGLREDAGVDGAERFRARVRL